MDEIVFHCFSGCNNVEQFIRKSKDTWTKLFLNSDLDVCKAFQLIPRHLYQNKDNLKVFAAKVYSKKHLKVTILQNYVGKNIYTVKHRKQSNVSNMSNVHICSH